MSARIATFVGVCLLLAVTVAPSAGDGLKPGDVLSQDNWQLAEGLLPPEMLQALPGGPVRQPDRRVADGRLPARARVRAATEANRGKLASTSRARSSTRRPGKQPPYIYGFPFPDVDREGPASRRSRSCGTRYYGYWYLGNSHNEVRLLWVNPDGIDREAGAGRLLHVLRRAARALPRRPTRTTSSCSSSPTTTYPTDLYGTTALTWRYRDSRQARLELGLRPGSAARARRQPVQPLRRLPRLRHEPGRRSVLRRQAGGLRVEAGRRADDQLRFVDPLSLEGKSTAEWLPQRRLARDLAADDSSRRLRGSGLEGHRLGADRAGARQAPDVDHRGDAEGQVLPVRQDPALPRQGDLPGRLQPQVQLEAASCSTPTTILGLPPTSATRPDGGEEWLLGLEHGLPGGREHQDEPRHGERPARPGQGRPRTIGAFPYDPSFFDFTTLQRFGK